MSLWLNNEISFAPGNLNFKPVQQKFYEQTVNTLKCTSAIPIQYYIQSLILFL